MLKNLLKIFGPAVLVYAVNYLAVILGGYEVLPGIDTVMHFLGGVAIGIMALMAWDLGLGLYEHQAMASIPFVVKAIAVIGFVSFIGVAWEWHEFLLDQWNIYRHVPFAPMQPSVADTMKDLFLDISGGALVLAIVELKRRVGKDNRG